MAMAMGGNQQGLPILEALTDEDRLEFISDIPRPMHARVDKLLVEAAEVDEFRALAHRLGVPDKAPDTNIAKKVVRTYLMTRTSVGGRQVEKLVEAYRGKMFEEPAIGFGPEAGLPGDQIPTGEDEGGEGEGEAVQGLGDV